MPHSFIFVAGPFALCVKYDVIDDVTRSVTYPFRGTLIPETVDHLKWYRLNKKTGARLPTRCVPENRCGAQASGWLNGEYPDVKDGVVQRKVCFHFHGNCCSYENTVLIRKCFEGFYVFKFESLPSSVPGRYCTTEEKESEGWWASWYEGGRGWRRSRKGEGRVGVFLCLAFMRISHLSIHLSMFLT